MQLQVRTNNITCVARQSVFAVVVGKQYLNARGKHGFSRIVAKGHKSREKGLCQQWPLPPFPTVAEFTSLPTDKTHKAQILLCSLHAPPRLGMVWPELVRHWLHSHLPTWPSSPSTLLKKGMKKCRRDSQNLTEPGCWAGLQDDWRNHDPKASNTRTLIHPLFDV